MIDPFYKEPHDPERGGSIQWYSVTVHPPAETKRPVGFADWPEKPKKRRKRKRR